MKPLPLKLCKNGYCYTQVLRGKRSCVYRQEVLKDNFYYEVFLIKTLPADEFKGKAIPQREKFPYNEAFGHWAWSYKSYDQAYKAFLSLESGKSNPNN